MQAKCPEDALLIDQRGDIRACGAAVARLAGRNPGELLGRGVWRVLPGWTPFDSMQPEGQPLHLYALQGVTVPVEVSCEALHLPGDTLYVVTVRRMRYGGLRFARPLRGLARNPRF